MGKNLLIGLGLVAVILTSYLWCNGPHSLVPAGEGERMITVSGSGTLLAAPDRARISLGVRSFGKDASQALDINNAKMAKIIAGLNGLGIERDAIGTSGFNLRRRTDRREATQQNADGFLGYDVNNTVTIETDQIDLVGTLLDEVTRWGATDISGLTFYLSNPETYLEEVRTAAVEDARQKAEQLSHAAGARLGRVLMITEGAGRGYPGPMKTLRVAEQSDVPVFASPETVRVDVSVSWEIISGS